MKLLLATQVLLPFLVVTKACTEFRVTAEDNSVIIGRSMEFGIDLLSNARGGDSDMKWTGMLVVSLRGVNFGFWSRLGCSGQNVIIFSRQGLV